ncbi:hypothetical protein LTR62_000516 [Meristemomyces frigidus]|uniref:NAD(P)-binding protein n=1 Tax=Meristemomyces frigidus TaxID=1508187 RepID=A0AAN7T985_9PEZI|nr:hypothetical protein LTR62_000516 [Meristemomyces frigidus]
MSKQLVWLVTGCSSGFGVEFVKSILARGDKAIATARNTDTLNALVKAGAASLQLDVSASAKEIDEKVQQAIAIYGHVDVLLANAGYAQYGAVEEIPENLILKEFQTNILGNIHLIQSIMPHWRSRQSGCLVVNSSEDSLWHTFPGFSAYSASKAALDRFIHLFGAETANLGYIKTLTIHPGPFRTDVAKADKHNMSDPLRARPDQPTNYQWLNDFFTDFVPKFHQKQVGDPQKLAEAVVDLVRGEGMAEGKTVPSNIPLGAEAFREARKHAEALLKVCDEWEGTVGEALDSAP